ncbi:MAG: hypothetical protein JXR37_35190 [Kiritimatiellae bacterium]|nr:hypothetical protein [Kiritimatiellia bacterium]
MSEAAVAEQRWSGPLDAAGLDGYTRELLRRVTGFEDDADPFERAKHATHVYRDRPDLPVVLKRAEIVALTLEHIPIPVLGEERIAGPAFRRLKVHGGVSDADTWRVRAFFPERHRAAPAWPIPADRRDDFEWWRARGPEPRVAARRAAAPWQRVGVASPRAGVGMHTLPDHGILLEAGIGGLRRRVARRLADGRLRPGQLDELRAMDRCLAALAVHCRRCAAALRRRAESEPDPILSGRLLGLAADCAALARERPRTFHQALQLLRLSHVTDILDTPGDAASYGRVDQLLWPFYADDLAAGRLTAAEGFELVCHFLIKHWCVAESENITLGGLLPDGRDGTNALSFMFLQAMARTGLAVNLSVRVHAGGPARFLRETLRVVRAGFGRPDIWNDDVVVPALVRHGVAVEDARDYAPLGCVEIMIPGRTSTRTMAMDMNLLKVLELVLNGGRCLVSGTTVWTDIPDRFADFGALRGMYHAKIAEIAAQSVPRIHEEERCEHRTWPRPWLTLLTRGGIEAARDMTAGSPRYNPVAVTLYGIADVVNSLYVVRKWVFEDRRLSLAELREVLRRDWEGHEALRQAALSRMPRFGQDHAALNAMLREEAAVFARAFAPHRTGYGDRFWPMIFGVADGNAPGKWRQSGASPSGRRAGEPLANSLQPSLAGEQGCITAVLRSVAEIDFTLFPGGIGHVQELDPALVRGEQGLEQLRAMVQGFFAVGGMEIGLNALSEAQLRDAQRHPDRYGHLMVRLFGLSARFVNLSPALQEQVIARSRRAAQRER